MKIGALLAIGFGEAGSKIITKNMQKGKTKQIVKIMDAIKDKLIIFNIFDKMIIFYSLCICF